LTNLIRNLTAFRLTRPRRRANLLGRVVRNRFAANLATRRGPSATLARAGVLEQQVRIGLGILGAATVVGLGVVAVNAVVRRRDRDEFDADDDE